MQCNSFPRLFFINAIYFVLRKASQKDTDAISPYHRNICYMRNVGEKQKYYNYIIYIIIIIYII